MKTVAFVLMVLFFFAYFAFLILDFGGVIPSEVSNVVNCLITAITPLITTLNVVSPLRKEMPAALRVAKYIYIFATLCLSILIILHRFVIRIPRAISITLMAIWVMFAVVFFTYGIIQHKKQRKETSE